VAGARRYSAGEPLSGVALKGDAHRAALAKLEGWYDEMVSSWRPLLVNLLAETGAGKTRLLQELYRHLAAQDPYWPAEICGANQRKEIVPSRERWDGRPRLFWLGLACYPAQDGSPSPAIADSLRRQLRVHARGLLVHKQRTLAAREAAIRAASAIGQVIGLELVRTLIELFGDARETKKIAAALLAGANSSDRSETDEELVRAMVEVAHLIDAQGCPVVLAVDDGHDVDPTTLAITQSLLVSPRGVLVITASWPSAIARQRQEGVGLGAWLGAIEQIDRVEELVLGPLSTETLAEIAAGAAPGLLAGGVDHEAALALAARANGNVLVLSRLIALAFANGLALRAEDIDALRALPREPTRVFQDVWERILSEEVRQMLQVAAVLGTPLHEWVLLAAAQTLMGVDRASLQRTVLEGLSLGWLVAIPDPYSEDRSLRFAESDYGEVAAHHAEGLIPRTRKRLVTAAVEQALSLPASTSVYAFTAAVRHAVALLEERPGQQDAPLAIFAYRKLAAMLWKSEPKQAVRLMDLALATQAQQGSGPDLELLADAARARLNSGDADAALALFDATLPLTWGLKAEQAVAAERFAEAIAAAREALDTEIAVPGSVAQMPMSEHDSVLVSLADVLTSANTLDGFARTDEVRALVWTTIERAARSGRTSEASLIAGIACEDCVLEEADLAGLDELGVPRPDLSPSPFPEPAQTPSLQDAAAMLARGDLDRAEEVLKEKTSRADSRTAVPLAGTLVDLGGARYAPTLAFLSLQAGEFRRAAQAYRLLLRHRIEQGEPRDLPSLAPIRAQLAEALAWSGDGEQALAVATASLEIAMRAADPDQLIRTFVALAHAHIALAQFTNAHDALRSAADRLSPAIQLPAATRMRIDAALCESYGMQGDWAGVVDLFNALPWSVVSYGDERRGSWRMRGWCAAARWRLSGDAYARALLGEARLLLRPQWIEATAAALEHLAAGMADPAAGASPNWVFKVRAWLVEAVTEAGREEIAASMAAAGGRD
jgi:hypothetical protein